MRVFVLGSVFPDSFTRNVLESLHQMGHEVDTFSSWRAPFWVPYRLRLLLNLAARSAGLDRPRPSLRRKLRRFEPDLVLNCYEDIEPALVAELRRRTRAVLVAWFPDVLVNLGRQYLLAAPYHALFFKDRSMVRFAREKLDRPAFFLPECCNPAWHRPQELTADERAFYGCDLTTAASMYYYRALLLELFADYDLKIWGRGYPPWLPSRLRPAYQNHFVAEQEKAKAFGAAKIVLNTIHYGEIEGVNARLFEAAGCGAFQICEYREALREFFEPETEVVTFRTREELKEKVDYYLARPTERRAIAERACARAHREHTYQHRLRCLLRTVEEVRSGP
ncbi:MAG: glycosyltransferase [Terriglobia bacterium]